MSKNLNVLFFSKAFFMKNLVKILFASTLIFGKFRCLYLKILAKYIFKLEYNILIKKYILDNGFKLNLIENKILIKLFSINKTLKAFPKFSPLRKKFTIKKKFFHSPFNSFRHKSS